MLKNKKEKSFLCWIVGGGAFDFYAARVEDDISSSIHMFP